MTRLLRYAATAIIAAPLTLVLVLAGQAPVRAALAAIQNDTPEARVDSYIGAIARGDEPLARALWRVDGHRPALDVRRTEVTRALAATDVTSHRVDHVEWWSFCCEPHIVEEREHANGARFTVIVGSTAYRFDLSASDHHDALFGRVQPTSWTIRDVYRLGDAPLWNTWPGR